MPPRLIGTARAADQAPSADELCAAVDAERDRRIAADFVYDFGATLAVDDAMTQIEAGPRALQMRDRDLTFWANLRAQAITAVLAGAPSALLPMRAEDNWNVQTTAQQVLEVLSAVTARGASLVFFGGALKSLIRNSEDPALIDTDSGWPS